MPLIRDKGWTGAIAVKMVDGADFATPETGIATNVVTGAYTKDGGPRVELDLSVNGRWVEIDATDHPGVYWVNITGGVTDTVGEGVLTIRPKSGSAYAACSRSYDIVSHGLDDIYDKVSTINVQASIVASAVWAEAVKQVSVINLANGASAAIQAVDNQVSTILQDMDALSAAVSLANGKLDVISNVINNTGVAVGNGTVTTVQFRGAASNLFNNVGVLANIGTGQVTTIKFLLAASASIKGIDDQLSTVLQDIDTLSAAVQTVDNEVSTANDKLDSISNVINNTGVSLSGNALAQVENSASAALQNLQLHKLLASTVSLPDDIILSSALGKLLDNGAAWSYDRTVDSLEVLGAAAGGTDWSTKEQNAIKKVLGVSAGSSVPWNPTTGILDTIDNQISTLLADNNSLSSAIATVDNQLSTVLQDIDTLSSAIQTVDDELSTANQNIDAIDNKVSVVDDQISTVLQNQGVLSAAIDVVDNKVSVVDDQVSTLLQDNNALSSAIATIDNQVSTLLADNNSLSSAIQTIDNEVSTANDGINAISNVVNNTGVAVAATAASSIIDEMMSRKVTIARANTFSTVKDCLQLARAQAAGDWTIAADVLKIDDVDGTNIVSMALTPGGGPYTARANSMV